MTTVLLCSAAPAAALRADCAAMGLDVLGHCAPAQLLAESARLAPDLLLCDDPQPAQALLPVLEAIAAHAPRPVLLFSRDTEVATLERALRSVHAYVVNGYAAARLRPLVQLARSRFALEREQRAALVELNQRFDERKLVDRAKGILMRARRIPEDDAFALLRAAAMQEQRRIGQVAQRVIDAERDAEAVNEAGRLRMLSQRLVALAALQCAGVAAGTAGERRRAAEGEADAHLARLERVLSRPTFGDLLDPLAAAWQALRELLRAEPRRAALPAIDSAAERMLGTAEALTGALEAASPLATLAVVNRAGRQRMLCQRLAKQSLIATLCEGEPAHAAAAAAVQTVEAFEQALARLDEAPLSSPAIRADLTQAALEWRGLLAAMREAGSEPGREQIALASEALLVLFERLTANYSLAARELLDGA